MIDKLPPELLRQHKGISFVGITTAFFCTDRAGNIFMAQRSRPARDEHGRWDYGAGGLKQGVTAEQNVIREIQEEYGVTPNHIEFLGYRDVFRTLPDGTPTHWIALDYHAIVDPAQVKINKPDIFDNAGWFDLDNLPSPLHSQVGAALQKYRDRLLAAAS